MNDGMTPPHPTRLFVTIWTLAALTVLTLEAMAIFGIFGPGTTLSDVVWKLRASALWRAVLVGLWAWLGWHWFAQSLTGRLEVWRDIAVIMLGAIAGAFLVRPR